MAKKTYVLTIEFNEDDEQIEYIQEEIIMPENEQPDSYILENADLVEMWEKEGVDLIKKIYPGEVGES
jgi:hypothetical protein